VRIQAIAVSSLVVLASACSSAPPPGPSAASIVARAADRARSAGTVSIASTISLPLQGLKHPVILTGQATIDFALHRASSTIEVAQLVTALHARAGAPSTFDFVFGGGSLYVRLAPPQGAKTWARIASAALAGPTGGNPFAQLGGSDPSSAIDILRGATGTATKMGSAVVNSVRTNEYHVTLDVAKASDAGGRTVAGALRAEFRTTKTIDARVWIDTRGRPVREVFTFGGPSGVTTVRHEFTRFGVSAGIKMPPDSEVLVLKDATAFGMIFQRALTGAPAKKPRAG